MAIAEWLETDIRTRWERLSEEDVARIGSDRARLVASLTDIYGWSPDEAETEVANWERDVEAGTTATEGDAVAQASADSFPASDPPGWIKQAPRAPKQAGPPPRGGAEQPVFKNRRKPR